MLNKQEVQDIRIKDIKTHTFRGSAEADKLIKQMKSPILVYFDPDIDGGFAGLLVCKFLSQLGKEFTWYCNSKREHGWFLPIDRVAGKDIIAVDFLITREQVIEICEAGCNLVSFDHHLNGKDFIEYTSTSKTRGIIINNQYPFEKSTSRYLSGAGVVFESIVAFNPSFNSLLHRALVGITLLSDIRDIENDNARGYLYDLYHHPYKGYIKYLIDSVLGERDYSFGTPRMDRNFVDYRFSPKLNACFRFNEETEVIQFLMCQRFLDLECHKMQKVLVEKLKSSSNVVEFEHLRVISFFVKDYLQYRDVLSSFVGLTAARFLDGKKSCICMSIGNGYVERASFRGRVNGLNYLEAGDALLRGVGHGSAFGIKELVPSGKLFKSLSNVYGSLEESIGWEPNIVRTANLSVFARRKAVMYAIENQYRLSQNRTFIKYTGHSIQRKRSYGDWNEYSVDGVSVLCFDTSKNFENGLIFPIMERGHISFYLE